MYVASHNTLLFFFLHFSCTFLRLFHDHRQSTQPFEGIYLSISSHRYWIVNAKLVLFPLQDVLKRHFISTCSVITCGEVQCYLEHILGWSQESDRNKECNNSQFHYRVKKQQICPPDMVWNCNRTCKCKNVSGWCDIIVFLYVNQHLMTYRHNVSMNKLAPARLVS